MWGIGIIAASLAFAISADVPAIDRLNQRTEPQIAATCSKLKEEFTGRRKICYYDCLGTTRAISIPAVEECPLSIDR